LSFFKRDRTPVENSKGTVSNMHHTAEIYLGRKANELSGPRSLSSSSPSSFRLSSNSSSSQDIHNGNNGEIEKALHESKKTAVVVDDGDDTNGQAAGADVILNEVSSSMDGGTSNNNKPNIVTPSTPCVESSMVRSPKVTHTRPTMSNVEDEGDSGMPYSSSEMRSITNGGESSEAVEMESKLKAITLQQEDKLKRLAEDHNSTKLILKALIHCLSPLPQKRITNDLVSQVRSVGSASAPDDLSSTPQQQSTRKIRSIKDLSPYFNDDNCEELESDNEDEDIEDWNAALESLTKPKGEGGGGGGETMNVDEFQRLCANISQISSRKSMKSLLREVLSNPQDSDITMSASAATTVVATTPPTTPLATYPMFNLSSNNNITPNSNVTTSTTRTLPPVPPPPRSLSQNNLKNKVCVEDMSPMTEEASNTTQNNEKSFDQVLEATISSPPSQLMEGGEEDENEVTFSSDLLTNKNIPAGMFHVIVETVSIAMKRRDIIHQEITRNSLLQLQEKLDAEYKKKLIRIQNEKLILEDEVKEMEKVFTSNYAEMQKESRILSLKNKELKQEIEKLHDKGKNDREVANIALQASKQQTSAFALALHEAEKKILTLRMSNGLQELNGYDPSQELSLNDIEQLKFVDDDYYEEARRDSYHGTDQTDQIRSRKPRGYKDFGRLSSDEGKLSGDKTFLRTKYAQRTEKFIPKVDKFDYSSSSSASSSSSLTYDRIHNHHFREEEEKLDEFFELRTRDFNAQQMKEDLKHEQKMNKILKHRSSTSTTTTFNREKNISSSSSRSSSTNKKTDQKEVDEYYDEEWGGYKLHSPIKSKRQSLLAGLGNMTDAAGSMMSKHKTFVKKVMKSMSPVEFFMFVIVPLSFVCLCLFVLIMVTTHSKQVIVSK
jgi:hypothetical protein